MTPFPDAPRAGASLILPPKPFGPETVTLDVPHGLTLAEILDLAEAEGRLDGGLAFLLVVTIGPHRVPPALWHRVRPKPGARVLVWYAPQDGGGGGGGSNPLKFLLQVAIVIGAAVATFFGGPLAGLAVTLLGGLLVNALFPIHQPTPTQRTQRYSLSGANNRTRPNLPATILLGRRRIFPARAASAYTRLSGQDVYLRMLLQPCVGWCDHSAPWIGRTPLEQYHDVTVHWRTRPDETATIEYFTETPGETNVSIELKSIGGWTTRAAPINATRLSVDIAFLAGLYGINKSSGEPKDTRTVAIEVRYGLRGVAPASATPAPIGSAGVVTFTMATVDSYRQNFEWAVAAGDYEVHMRRVTADKATDDNRTYDNSHWLTLRAFAPGCPIVDLANTPWIEIEIKATDQLNNIVDDFSFVATSLVQAVGATGPSGPLIASRNPADLFAAATFAPLSDLLLDADERDYAALATWRALCAAKGWHCDLIEENEVSVGELLQRIAACGRAKPSLDFGALTVVVDDAKPAPRQLFAARNVHTFRGELGYPDRVDGLRLRFANEDKDYADDTVTVYAPGYGPLTASRFESTELRERCNVAEVERVGQRLIAERISRPEVFRFDQDLECLVVREGDRALLAHPAALIGQVGARVHTTLARGAGASAQAGIRLDEIVTTAAGTHYAFAWRNQAGVSTAEMLADAPGDTTDLWFPIGSAPSPGPQPGDLGMFGERSTGTLDVIVLRILPKDALTAEISCVDYAPALQVLDAIDVVSDRTPPNSPPPTRAAPPWRRGETPSEALLTQFGGLLAETAGQTLALVDDGVLTPTEKRSEVPQLQAIFSAQAGLTARATMLGLTGTAVVTDYTNVLAALSAILAGLTTPYSWDSYDGDTTIADPTGFATAVALALAKQAALQTAFGSTADNSNRLLNLQNSGCTGLTITPTNSGYVNISAHTRIYGDGARVSVAAGTINPGNSTAGWIYYDQASRAGGAVTYQYTEDDSGQLGDPIPYATAATPDRHLVGTFRTPAAGATGTPPGGNPRIPPGRLPYP